MGAHIGGAGSHCLWQAAADLVARVCTQDALRAVRRRRARRRLASPYPAIGTFRADHRNARCWDNALKEPEKYGGPAAATAAQKPRCQPDYDPQAVSRRSRELVFARRFHPLTACRVHVQPCHWRTASYRLPVAARNVVEDYPATPPARSFVTPPVSRKVPMVGMVRLVGDTSVVSRTYNRVRHGGESNRGDLSRISGLKCATGCD